MNDTTNLNGWIFAPKESDGTDNADGVLTLQWTLEYVFLLLLNLMFEVC
jgi:hypothetical protein